MKRLRDVAAFCHFYRMTPAEYRGLTLSEYQAFTSYMREYLEAQRGNHVG